MDFRVKHVRRYLEAGNKVRLAVVFRGREITHPQTGKNALDRVVAATPIWPASRVIPNGEGRRMIAIIAPKLPTWSAAPEEIRKRPARGRADQERTRPRPRPRASAGRRGGRGRRPRRHQRRRRRLDRRRTRPKRPPRPDPPQGQPRRWSRPGAEPISSGRPRRRAGVGAGLGAGAERPRVGAPVSEPVSKPVSEPGRSRCRSRVFAAGPVARSRCRSRCEPVSEPCRSRCRSRCRAVSARCRSRSRSQVSVPVSDPDPIWIRTPVTDPARRSGANPVASRGAFGPLYSRGGRGRRIPVLTTQETCQPRAVRA
ncbi:MAG: translation initiation factor IF-3 C-terminal domain-containing protein [Myxococcales bacterium]|nr:translation initiation factor IF-3 C-terminal domain-containing protein [Myxococcales bacterium]